MIRNGHRSTLHGVAALVGMMGAAASVPAFGQHPPSYGIQQDQRHYAPMGDGTGRLCSNVLQTYPADHLLLTVRSNPAIRIHCGSVLQQSPTVLTFETMRGIDWYRTHAGYRHIEPGEGPND